MNLSSDIQNDAIFALRQAKEKIKSNDRKFKAFIENSADGIAILSAEGRTLYISPSIKQILGYTYHEGMHSDLFATVHPQDILTLTHMLKQAMVKPGIPVKGDAIRIPHKDGTWRWIEGVITNKINDRAISGIIYNFRDVTERKLAEEKLVLSNRLYAFISRINKCIVRAEDEQSLLNEACNIAIDTGKFKMALISLVDEQNSKLNLAAQCNVTPQDLDLLHSISYNEKCQTAEVIRSDSCYVINNFETEPGHNKSNGFATTRGFGSAIILLLKKAGKIFYTFNLFASEINSFPDQEVALLKEVADDISFALDFFEKDKLKLESQEKLKQSELHLNQAQAVAHLGSWKLNFETGIATWSCEQLKIFGLAAENSKQTYQSWLSFIHPEDTDYVTQVINKVKTSLTNAVYSYRIVKKDGTIRHIDSQAHIMLSAAGAAVGLYGISHDVTERKEAEKALKESESNLQAIFKNTSEGFILTDINGIIKFFNNQSKDTIHLNTYQEIAIGDSIFDFIQPSRKANFTDAITKVLRGETLKYDYPYTRKNGEVKWFDFTVNPVYNAGVIAGLSISSADITKRKQSEQLLQESEIFNKGVLASLTSNIAVIDKSGNIIAVNKAWDDYAKENGAASGAFVSVKSNYFGVCKDAIAAGDMVARQTLKGIRSVLNKERQNFELEYPCHSPSSEHWFSVRVSNFGDNDTKAVIAHQDITARKKSEKIFTELAEFNQTLIEASPMGITSYDAISGDCLSVNTAFAKIIGATREEFLKLNFRLIKSWQQSGMRQEAEETLQNGKVHQHEIRITTTFGKKIWINYRFIRFLNKERPHLLMLVNDISERKSAEESLRKSESNLNAVIENTDAFIYSLDRDFKYITFNNALYVMMKNLYGLHITPGYHVFDFIKKFDPEGVAEWNEIYSKALKGEIVKFEKEFVVNDHYSYTRFSIHPIWENKNVVGLSCFVNDITKEKQAEEENRFKANLLNTIGQAAIGTDLKGAVNYWNKAAEVIYGWTKEEAAGKNINELMRAGITEEQDSRIMKELMQGHSWSGEFTVQRKNKTFFPVCVTNSPVYDHKQNLSGIIGISSDMTEKKNFESILDKTNKMARIGSYEIDLVKNTIYWSAMTKQIHEVDGDFNPDIKSAVNFYKAGSGRETIIRAVEAAIDSGTAYDLELEIVTAKGNERWVRTLGAAEFVENKCVKLNGSFQDIDAGKKAEIEVLKAYEEKNIILESIGDAFFAVDKNWTVTYWNNQAEKVLHLSKDKILGHDLWEVFPNSVNTESYKKYHHAVNTKAISHFKAHYPSLDKWFDISAYPSATGLSVFFKDITQQRKSEEERLKMTSDLIQRNKDLEQFSYIVSHNLRAPVANIIGIAEELGDDMNEPEVKETFLKELCLNVERLDNFIIDLNNILQVKREIIEKKETVNLSRLITSIQSDIKNLISKEDVRIITDFTEVNEFATLKSYLHSIFYNLISNSIKFRQADVPPLILIKTNTVDGELIITFKDNGTGIDLAKKGDQVFGLYKRFHRNVEGKGMGLFMVKTQVETLGGKITIKSEVNKGTEFKIVFEL